MPTPDNEYDLEEARVVAWFVTGLRHEAIRLAKKYKRLREHELLILNARLKEDAGSDSIAEMVDTVASTTDTLAQVEENLFLQEALSLLTPLQQKVITATILEGACEQEVANEMGITHQAVNRIKGRALNKLRKYYCPGQAHRQVEPYPGHTQPPSPEDR
jgi:RNA polymerase sigma factor (sigma-70 family)